jgi:hypothetical protein
MYVTYVQYRFFFFSNIVDRDRAKCKHCMHSEGINSGVFCLSESPSDSDFTLQLAMLLVPRCRSRYLFPLRHVCCCLQLKIALVLSKLSRWSATRLSLCYLSAMFMCSVCSCSTINFIWNILYNISQLRLRE